MKSINKNTLWPTAIPKFIFKPVSGESVMEPSRTDDRNCWQMCKTSSQICHQSTSAEYSIVCVLTVFWKASTSKRYSRKKIFFPEYVQLIAKQRTMVICICHNFTHLQIYSHCIIIQNSEVCNDILVIWCWFFCLRPALVPISGNIVIVSAHWQQHNCNSTVTVNFREQYRWHPFKGVVFDYLCRNRVRTPWKYHKFEPTDQNRVALFLSSNQERNRTATPRFLHVDLQTAGQFSHTHQTSDIGQAKYGGIHRSSASPRQLRRYSWPAMPVTFR